MENEKVITDYKIIKGLPEQVEQDVNQRLKEGWFVKGDLISHTCQMSDKQLVLQNMVKYIYK